MVKRYLKVQDPELVLGASLVIWSCPVGVYGESSLVLHVIRLVLVVELDVRGLIAMQTWIPYYG